MIYIYDVWMETFPRICNLKNALNTYRSSDVAFISILIRDVKIIRGRRIAYPTDSSLPPKKITLKYGENNCSVFIKWVA